MEKDFIPYLKTLHGILKGRWLNRTSCPFLYTILTGRCQLSGLTLSPSKRVHFFFGAKRESMIYLRYARSLLHLTKKERQVLWEKAPVLVRARDRSGNPAGPP
jgi:hypothetical protein